MQIDGRAFHIVVEIFQGDAQFDTDGNRIQKIKLLVGIIAVVRFRVHKGRFQNTDLIVVTQRFDTHVF